MCNENSPITDFESIITELERISPTREQTAGSIFSYRDMEGAEYIDDSLEESELNEIEPEETEEAGESEIIDFEHMQSGPLAAADCGIVRLGETKDGLIIALRSAIVIEDRQNMPQVKLFKTGPLYLHNQFKKQLFYQIGCHLNKPDLYVELDNSDPPQPVAIKRGVADNVNQYGDRFRSWFERLTHKIAMTSIENGTILLDGALTTNTRDVSDNFLDSLSTLASNNGNSIIGISKKSMLQIQNKPIKFWLDEAPMRACYCNLTNIMRTEGRERVLGNAYAVRFSKIGATFRMDVKPAEGQLQNEAVNQFYSSSLMRCGYPDILVKAHAYSYFTTPDVYQLQANAGAKYGLIGKTEPNLTGIFAPFGGRFK
ncbi:MAG: hypothetical protein ACFFG0_27330 [Candidatus Thorarchaeota archaeon]